MKIAVAPNPAKRRALSVAKDAIKILSTAGCDTILIEGLYEQGGRREAAAEDIGRCQVLLAVGGDGTIICAAKIAAKLGMPVLGINAGKLGFTAGVEPDQLGLLFELAQGGWREESRMMLHAKLLGRGGQAEFLALNDAVVSSELATITEYRMAIGEGPGYT